MEPYSDEDFAVLLEALETVGVLKEIKEESVWKTTERPSSFTVTDQEVFLDAPDLEQGALEDSQRVRFTLSSSIQEEDMVRVLVSPGGNIIEDASQKQTVDVDVAKGGKIVIGGLFKEVTVKSTWKMPVLGDIPFFGAVFRNQRKRLRKLEVIVFLTPELVIEE